MSKTHVTVAFLIGYLSMMFGLTWMFGPWGLLAPGALLAGSMLFINVKE